MTIGETSNTKCLEPTALSPRIQATPEEEEGGTTSNSSKDTRNDKKNW